MVILPEDETPQDASSPNERTPLKSPTSPVDAHPPRELSSPPPPPYGVAINQPPPIPGPQNNQNPWLAASGSRSPQPPYSPHPPGPTAGDELSPREVRSRVLKRLFTAYLVAWVILVLWSTFIGSLPHHHLDDYGPGTFLDSWVTDYIESISVFPRTGNEDGDSTSGPNRPRYGSGRGRRRGSDDPNCTCTGKPKKPSPTSTPTSTHPIVTIKPTPTVPPLRPLPIDYPPLYPMNKNNAKNEQKSEEGEDLS